MAGDLGRQGGDPRALGAGALDLSTCVNGYGPAPAGLAALHALEAPTLRGHPYRAAGTLREAYAERLGVPMADVGLAWHWARGVTAPIVGCSRPSRVDDAVRALEVTLTPEDVAYLEELYLPHELVGPVARPGENELAGTTVGSQEDKH